MTGSRQSSIGPDGHPVQYMHTMGMVRVGLLGMLHGAATLLHARLGQGRIARKFAKRDGAP